MTCLERALKALTIQAALLLYRGPSKPQTSTGIPLNFTKFLRECNFDLLMSFQKKKLKLDTVSKDQIIFLEHVIKNSIT
jgi:hypothetical protein